MPAQNYNWTSFLRRTAGANATMLTYGLRLPNENGPALRNDEPAGDEPAGSNRLPVAELLHAGTAEISNWLKPRTTGDQPIRHLDGRIDELIILKNALKAEEIAKILSGWPLNFVWRIEVSE